MDGARYFPEGSRALLRGPAKLTPREEEYQAD